jgi:phage terminase large subunit-like protein
MKHIEALVLGGRLHHDGNPALAWMMANVVAHRDRRDNLYPTKQAATNKIDGALALIAAMGRAMHATEPAPPPPPPRVLIINNEPPRSDDSAVAFLEDEDGWAEFQTY